ncbi:MAG: hypothetical protein AB8F78_19170 [Saprospiraceae bacterium]
MRQQSSQAPDWLIKSAALKREREVKEAEQKRKWEAGAPERKAKAEARRQQLQDIDAGNYAIWNAATKADWLPSSNLWLTRYAAFFGISTGSAKNAGLTLSDRFGGIRTNDGWLLLTNHGFGLSEIRKSTPRRAYRFVLWNAVAGTNVTMFGHLWTVIVQIKGGEALRLYFASRATAMGVSTKIATLSAAAQTPMNCHATSCEAMCPR